MSAVHDDIHSDLIATVERYAADRGGLVRVRRLRESANGFDRDGWRRAGELGWLGLLAPESAHGAGLGLVEMTVLMRAAGRALLPEPLVAGGVLAARILLRSASERARGIVSDLVRGGLFAAVAWQEVLAQIDAAQVELRIADGRLSGTKSCVVFGAAADGFLISAVNDRGVGVYWIERTRDGIDYRSMRRADGSEHGALSLNSVRVGAQDLIIEHGVAQTVLREAVDESVVCVAASLLGTGEQALASTLAHLKTRVQFGKPIGSFQALQHRCVDLYVRKELAAAALDAVLREWERADAVRRSALASRVKARCADAALEICRQAVQMHGAMGFTDECDIGLYLKRALVDSAWLGNAQLHRRRYARLALHPHGAERKAEAV